MATTTNYSWVTPEDTDLVKDGAAAIRTLGSSADTTVKNLNPGTTAGDIDYYTSGTAKARIAIGTAGQVLQVNAGATAPEWATPVLGGLTLLETISLSGASVTSSSIPATYKHLFVLVKNVYGSIAANFELRFNSDTGNNYYTRRMRVINTTFGALIADGVSSIENTIQLDTSSTATDRSFAAYNIYRYADTDITYGDFTSTCIQGGTKFFSGSFLYDQSAAISTITFITSAGTFTAGDVYIYGSN